MKFFYWQHTTIKEEEILKEALKRSEMVFDQHARIVTQYDEASKMVTVRDAAVVEKTHQVSFDKAMPINVSTLKGVLSLETWWKRFGTEN